jgi:splicing factor 3A subunit 1
MGLIDWHDFVVVETIEFFDDEADLPAPASVEQLETQMEVDDEEMDMEDDTAEQPGPQPRPAGQPAPPAKLAQPAQPPPPPPPEEPPLPPPPTNLRILKEPIKRMHFYFYRYAHFKFITNLYHIAKPQAKAGGFLVLCPRCNQHIPENEYNEHMRIELLDPKYSAQKKMMDERRKEALNSYTDDISRNLRGLAEKRTDILAYSFRPKINNRVCYR